LSPFEDYAGSMIGTAVTLNVALDTDGVLAAAAPAIGAAYGQTTTQVLKNLDKTQKGYSPVSILSEAGQAQFFSFLFPDLPAGAMLNYANRTYGVQAANTFAQLGTALRAASVSVFSARVGR
jgi:hypothetical protein